MAHHTRFAIIHNDGHTQQFVGHPKSTRKLAELERTRLSIDDGYDLRHLHITEIPN